MNLGQLRTSLQAKGYATDTATAQNEAINDIYRRVAGTHRWPWLEAQSSSLATTAGTAAYAVSSITDLMYIDAVRIEASPDLPTIDWLTPQDFRNLEHDDRTNATPWYWTYEFGQVKLYPAPDKVYTLRLDYIKRPPALSGDSDTPLFESTYHDILVWGALMQIGFRERDWSALSYARQEYGDRLHEMERAYGVKQKQTARQVARSAFWKHIG